jgi:hypothetical protein
VSGTLEWLDSMLSRAGTIVLLAILASPAAAQDAGVPDSLFQSDQILEVTISAALRTLVRERPKEGYVPGIFTYKDSNGDDVPLDIEIRARGNFRHANCDFPPLRLNFKESQTDGTLFEHQKIMKLVVHCGNSKRYEQMVLREYLVYLLMNELTDLSFKARLLRINYHDDEERRKDQVRFAFLIEHKKRLGKRHGSKVLGLEKTTISAIQPAQLNLMSLFELFIGNTDFSPIAGAPGRGCCHNFVLFGNGIDKQIAIPYDFDQSGFVDAPYASPNENFKIRNVRQRYYRGRCVNNAHVPASLERFREKRQSFYALVAEQEGLDDGVRKKLVKYIDKFYELIDNPKNVEKQIIKKCA